MSWLWQTLPCSFHSYKFWELGEKVPVVVEIIDQSDEIKDFLNETKPMLE